MPQFAWIVRMIDGQFPWVTETWVREAHANSVRLLGDGPIEPLLALHQAKLEGPPRTEFPRWVSEALADRENARLPKS